jgi:Tfp pilus assembly protein PilO
MSANDRTILLVLPVIAAVVAFWMLVLSPKRDDAKKLEDQVTQLESTVAAQEQAAAAGQAARKSFPRDYQQLVVLGKAVPVDDETPSFLVQLNRISEATGADFRAISLSSGSGDAASATAATPTESSAALLPIGATVGSAGLPILGYELTFIGSYFEVADFMAGVDRLVKTKKGLVDADGRLVTIDGFTMAVDEAGGSPVLLTTLNVTTYVSPADQGLTAGATPAGPSLVGGGTTTAPTTTTSATTAPAP